MGAAKPTSQLAADVRAREAVGKALLEAVDEHVKWLDSKRVIGGATAANDMEDRLYGVGARAMQILSGDGEL